VSFASTAATKPSRFLRFWCFGGNAKGGQFDL
jgi:hypothetical protein